MYPSPRSDRPDRTHDILREAGRGKPLRSRHHRLWPQHLRGRNIHDAGGTTRSFQHRRDRHRLRRSDAACNDPHPNQPATTYRFEYGPTSAYGTTVPREKDTSETHPTRSPGRSQALRPIRPITSVWSRATVWFPTTTADQAFTTYSGTQASTCCPNEQVRKESDINPETGMPFSLQLPECRAYEMVSPALKNGAPVSDVDTRPLVAGSTCGEGRSGRFYCVDQVFGGLAGWRTAGEQ